ncbi:acyl-CoA desaturase, partial [Acidimicrobiaceae bacterium USS-CC1]|nr:acyl-CoA desaturase [Acidiferrimicrobium australe]
MTTTELPPDPAVLEPLGEADGPCQKQMFDQVALAVFLIVPFAALVAAVPLLWGRGLGWRDVAIAVVMYAVTGHGITVGFHRHFTHHSFRAARWLQVALAVCGSMAIQGPIIQWVADHRRHHRFSDRDGDPHSPWRYGRGLAALTKGFFYSHIGWMFEWEQTSQTKYAPDLCADRAVKRVSQLFPLWVTVSMLLPPLVGGLWSWSWQGAWWAFFWGSLVRVGLLYHVTFAINSVCHLSGRRPYRTKDRSGNVWWLALLSMGES